jgi:hypothetical protein
MEEFCRKVCGKAPVLVLVEYKAGWFQAAGVCGGLAAVLFLASRQLCGCIADFGCIEDVRWRQPSFVFSLRPVVERYALKGRAHALRVEEDGFGFGNVCLAVQGDGQLVRGSDAYAVPLEWGAADPLRFTRFEIWRVAL